MRKQRSQKREKINRELLGKIQLDTERWGVTITRVEIFNISPPGDIIRSMQMQIKAERDRRSDVLKSDGNRLASVIKSHGRAARLVLHAEGDRASDIKRAKGTAQAKIMLAEAQAKCLDYVSKVVEQYGVKAVEYLTAIQYLNSLRTLAVGQGPQKSKIVMFPSECVNSIEDIVRLNTRKNM